MHCKTRSSKTWVGHVFEGDSRVCKCGKVNLGKRCHCGAEDLHIVANESELADVQDLVPADDGPSSGLTLESACNFTMMHQAMTPRVSTGLLAVGLLRHNLPLLDVINLDQAVLLTE